MPELLHGVYTALVTPFTKSGEIDWDSYNKLLEFQLSSKISGVVVCGSTGETPTLTQTEKAKLLKVTVEKFKGETPIIVGVGSNSTAETLANCQQAIEGGADGLLVVTPYYNKPGPEGLYLHFKTIAEKFASTPIVLYDVPSRTGISIPVDIISRLSNDLKNIIGIKDATGDIGRVTTIRMNSQKNFKIVLGEDSLFYPALTLGADGVISVASNLIPKQFMEIYNSVKNNNFDNGLKIHNSYFELLNGLFIETNPIPVKWALKKHGVISEDAVRLPLVSLSSNGQETLDTILKSCNNL